MLAPIGVAAGEAGLGEGIGPTPAAGPLDAPLAPMSASVAPAAIITQMADNAAMPFRVQRRTCANPPFKDQRPQASWAAVSVV